MGPRSAFTHFVFLIDFPFEAYALHADTPPPMQPTDEDISLTAGEAVLGSCLIMLWSADVIQEVN